MMHEITLSQLATLEVDPQKPLLICDVDEVVVHFTSDFENYLLERALKLDTSVYAFNGNIRSIADDTIISDQAVSDVITNFFRDRTKFMEPISGAIAALQQISKTANVVMLTNLPHDQGEDRRHNLRGFDLNFPLITNSGPKGPAIKNIAKRVSGPVVFVDDSPHFISSAYEFAPHVHLIHFVQDVRFDGLIERFPFVSLRTGTWDEATPHILDIINR